MHGPMLRLTGTLALVLTAVPVPADDQVIGPVPRSPAQAGIGRLLPDMEVRSLDGELVDLAPRDGEQATVLAWTSITCPLTRKFAPLIGRHSQSTATEGVRWVFIDATGSDTPSEFRTFAEQSGFDGALVHDPKFRVTWALGCTSTTEVLVIDSRRTIRYRGCVDDRYGIGYAHDEPGITPLLDAIESVRNNRPVLLPATTAPGCELGRDESMPGETTPTYHGSISRIMAANCVRCHRSDGPGPFPLESFEEVAANARMIKRVVTRRTMPPWFADPSSHEDHGLFMNDSSLPKQEIDAIVNWVDNGRPEGDEADAPHLFPTSERWSIGTPDHVVRIPDPVVIKAEGTMPYVNVTVDPGFEKDVWVRAWEVLPTERSVLHHALVFSVPPGERGRFGPTDGFLAAYVPGNGHVRYEEGRAKHLPAGSRIHFQIHYTPNGVQRTDQLAIGLVVSDVPPREAIQTIGIADTSIRIPPGSERHIEGTTIRLPDDVTLLSLTPHMHVRGSGFKCTARDASGVETTLLDIPSYDFNWQLRYAYAEPPRLAKGTEISITGIFDNSSSNPANPDPEQQVRWGQQTDDEMLIGYAEYVVVGDELRASMQEASDRTIFEEQGRRLIERWDDDGDGRVSREEVPERRRAQFMLVDLDADGYVDLEEFVQAAMRFSR